MQESLGRRLHAELRKACTAVHLEKALNEEKGELIILSEEEYPLLLPWVLLKDSEGRLVSRGWSVSLAGRPAREAVELPPSPRLLVVIPQPADNDDATLGEEHLRELEAALALAAPRYALAEREPLLAVERTWSGFKERLRTFRPDAFYFYGHGHGTPQGLRLLFAEGAGNRSHLVPALDVEECLRHAPGGPPRVAFVNCCRGEVGGWLGAGQALGRVVPAVVTQRTVAPIRTARRQGLAFWEQVLLQGVSPHEAMTELLSDVPNQGGTYADFCWMNPVLYRHYGEWRSHPPPPASHGIEDAHWHIKLDRDTQIARVHYDVDRMLASRHLKAFAFVWWGEEGLGVELFRQRPKIELEGRLKEMTVVEYRADWPDHFAEAGTAFQTMTLRAFGVSRLEEIPARVRADARVAGERGRLIYLHHSVVRGERVREIAESGLLGRYLEWWNAHVAEELGERLFAVLGLPFVVADGKGFRPVLGHGPEAPDPDLSRMVVRRLEPFAHVTRDDLLDFLKLIGVKLPAGSRERLVAEVMEEASGYYEVTVEALRRAVRRVWDPDGPS